MDSMKYKVLLRVAELGSYSKACDEFGYTPSGISKMIINMEDEVGFPLVVRNNKGIALTAEAKRLIPYIRKIVSEMDNMEEELVRITESETGIVRIGTFPSISYAYIPKILKNFGQMHPNIRVEVIEEHNIELLAQWLEQGKIDIGLFSQIREAGYDWIGLKKEPFVAILKKGHPLAAESVISIDDLFAENLILFKPHEGEDPDISFLDKYIEKYGPTRYTVNSDHTIVKLVMDDNAVTIFPELIAKQSAEMFNVVYRQLDDYAMREIGIVLRSKMRISPAVRMMIECIKYTVPNE